jgi:hypothetical protein
LVSQLNDTLTNFADHCEQFSYDAINRYLRGERITPRLVWENVHGQVLPTPRGSVLFDDTVTTLFWTRTPRLSLHSCAGSTAAMAKP